MQERLKEGQKEGELAPRPCGQTQRCLPGPQKFSSRSRIRFCSLSRNSWFFPSPMFSAYSAGREQRDTGFECNRNKGRATTPADTTAESTPTVLHTAKWELMQGALMVSLPVPRVKALHNKHLLTLIKALVAGRQRTPCSGPSRHWHPAAPIPWHGNHGTMPKKCKQYHKSLQITGFLGSFGH